MSAGDISEVKVQRQAADAHDVTHGPGERHREHGQPKAPIAHGFFVRLGQRAWVAAYDIEQARERHATNQRYLRSAACCVALAVLRLGGWA